MKITKFLFIAITIATASLRINAQSPVPKPLELLLNKTLDSMRVLLKNKALSAAIQLPNGMTWASASGISSVTPAVNASPDQTYLIGSCVKTMTAACILQLADEKKLYLDDKISKHLDSITHINPNVTIRQLLRMQSGLYDILAHPNNQTYLLNFKDSVFSYSKMFKLFLKPQNAAPEEKWEYSNTNYFLLAMIIEKITKNPYHVEFRKRFITPLQLNSYKIPAHESLPTNIAHVWIDLNKDGTLDDAHTFYTGWKSLNGIAGSAGGYYATATDLTRWMRTYMRGDLLSVNMMNEAKKTVLSNLNGTTTKYGLGLMERDILGIKAIGHGGDLSYSAGSWYFPSKDLSISVLNNDSKVISWNLIPTVAALLKVINNNGALLDAKEDFSEKFEMQIAPNPFDNQLIMTIDLKNEVKEMQFILSNSLGAQEMILKKSSLLQGKQQFIFDQMENTPKGLHFVNVFADGVLVKSLKVVKN